MKRPPTIIRDEALRRRVIDLISSLDLAKPWSVTVEPYVRKRSLDQNALYWKWIGVIHNDTGQDADDIHEILMRQFLTPRTVEHLTRAELVNDGRPLEIYSTRKLKVGEFSEYLNKIEGWASSTLGIALPHPEDLHRHDR